METLDGTIIKQITELLIQYGANFLGALLILIIGLVVASWARRLIFLALGKIPMFDKTLQGFFSSLVKYIIIIVTGLSALSQLGVQTASLITVFGAASLAIGLAFQGTLSSVASGVMLLFFRPFKVGDYVDAGGVSGKVMEINLFFTRLKDEKNIKIVVPNATVWGKAVKNHGKERAS